MEPTPDDRVCDPAAGTGGFLCNAYEYVLDQYGRDPDRDELRALQTDLVEGGAVPKGRAHVCDERLSPRHWRRQGGRPHRARQPVGAVERRVLDGPRQSALRQEAEPPVRERGRRHRARGSGRRPRRLLDLHRQQAAQLRPAHLHPAEDRRSGGRGGPGQRAVRGRGRREGPPEPAGKVPRPHAATAADWHLVLAGRQGERDLLRQEGRPRRTLDRPALGLRLAHQHALHVEAEAYSTRGLRRIRRVLQAGPRARARSDLERGQPGRALASLRLRGSLE